ncbi:MAG: hypothetical protein KGL12_11565 [Rhodospirillales bacterium]|nr:hypothetical protein [Rhodospirillales bacterium]
MTITLDPLPAAPNRVPRARLIFDGQPSGQVLDGACLEAEFAVAAGHLLFVTDDVPFEEGLRLHLIAADGRLLDTRSLHQAYASPMLRDVRRIAADRFHFRFLGPALMEIRVRERPCRWCWRGRWLVLRRLREAA